MSLLCVLKIPKNAEKLKDFFLLSNSSSFPPPLHRVKKKFSSSSEEILDPKNWHISGKEDKGI